MHVQLYSLLLTQCTFVHRMQWHSLVLNYFAWNNPSESPNDSFAGKFSHRSLYDNLFTACAANHMNSEHFK